ncbi:type II toxin-antitoxin system VapB family antitoxin [Microbacterium invictum]|uniref:Antitoxin VapB n=1 Tax=Microbacterium invictum TaxID=515415 RepID=A0AA40SRN7_9MICO|nr:MULTISPECIES: type II toxin-antitoxin system VapB family antitoxin [Microbacterium]MBB4141000.1 antitoxin VapB [Microbacterium invictum]
MSLNIKNEGTHALVRELAALTGMSQTSAVEDAVRRRLHELQGETGGVRASPDYSPEEIERRRVAVDRILADFRAHTTPEQRAALATADDDLYDELGLPK